MERRTKQPGGEPQFEIVEIELGGRDHPTFVAEEVVGSHIREAGYKTLLVLVLRKL